MIILMQSRKQVFVISMRWGFRGKGAGADMLSEKGGYGTMQGKGRKTGATRLSLLSHRLIPAPVQEQSDA